MSSFYSSPVSPSSDPCTYVSILRNIKRKAINAGARPQDFDAYLRHILLVVNGPQYRGYTESDKTWHIDLFAWEHFFTEPFPFLADCDFHPNGNSTTIIVRNPSTVRPLDIIFTTSPRVPPQVPVRDPSNRFRGLHTQVGVYAPGLILRDPPPRMGSLIGGGKEVGSPSAVTSGGETKMNREVVGGSGEEMMLEAMANETPSSTDSSRHHRKRPRRRSN